MSEFSENMKSARLAINANQKDIAMKVGVAKSTYSLYENGKREPNVLMIKKIAKALSVSADYLLGIESPIELPTAPEERWLVKGYKDLDYYGKQRVAGNMRTELMQLEERAKRGMELSPALKRAG